MRRDKKKELFQDISLAQEAEVQELIARFEAKSPTGQQVAELEGLLRQAIFRPTNALVEQLLQRAAQRIEEDYQPRPGETFQGYSDLSISCLFGSFTIKRAYYYHRGKGEGHFPADASLGLEGAYSPALARLICLEGADESSFGKAAEHLKEVGGIQIEDRQIQRVIQRVGPDVVDWNHREVAPGKTPAEVIYISADATGTPMRASELVGIQGKGAGGKASTRMVNLGCVFTQLRTDQEGSPMRDYDSTTYTSSFESVSDFGVFLRREAIGRGLFSTPESVLLIDGATGLEKLGQDYFPDAVQIVDFYHATEHLPELCKLLLGHRGAAAVERRRKNWRKRLLNGGVEKIIAQARKEAEIIGKTQEAEKLLGYFVHNVKRMQYRTFRQRGFFIGSGVVEAGCRSIVGTRCKQSGMRWSVDGAENVIAFRCVHASRRLDDFWKYRRNKSTQRNDSLPMAA